MWGQASGLAIITRREPTGGLACGYHRTRIFLLYALSCYHPISAHYPMISLRPKPSPFAPDIPRFIVGSQSGALTNATAMYIKTVARRSVFMRVPGLHRL